MATGYKITVEITAADPVSAFDIETGLIFNLNFSLECNWVGFRSHIDDSAIQNLRGHHNAVITSFKESDTFECNNGLPYFCPCNIYAHE